MEPEDVVASVLASHAEEQNKGLQIDTTQSDTKTCSADTPRGEGWHVFVSVRVVSI